MRAADEYYKRQLVIKYGLVPFSDMIQSLKNAETHADLHYKTTMLRNNFTAFCRKIELIRYV